MKILKGFKYRIYPTEEQEANLRQQVGNCRFVWNKLLEANNLYYGVSKKFLWYPNLWVEIKSLRKEYEWLNKSDVHSYQQVALHLEKALRAMKTGKGYPKFKKRGEHDSIPFDRFTRIEKGHIEIPKLKVPGLKARQGRRVKIVQHRPLEGKPKSMTVSLDVDQWFVSILCEIEIKVEQEQKQVIGLDLGLTHFVTLSDGTRIDNPRFLKNSERKLRRRQRKLSRKVKGSNNRRKQRIKVARAHRKIKRQRLDFLHKVSSQLIAKAGVICIEDLAVKNMIKNHRLAKSISDVGWGEFVRQLEYKASWNGVELRKADRFYPSSKLCSGCGHRKADLQLSDRTYLCEKCGLVIDRDVNAAINLSRLGTSRIHAWGDTSVGDLERTAKSRHVSLKQEKDLIGPTN